MVNKLERIVGKGRKITLTSLFGLGLSLSNLDSKADVLLYPTVETFDSHILTNRLVVGQKYILKIWADNTQETFPTVGFDWGITTNFEIPKQNIPQPSPWYTNELGPDFFDGFEMEKPSFANYVGFKFDSSRYTKEKIENDQHLIRIGPTNKVGVIGCYYLNPSLNNLNVQIINFKRISAYTSDLSFGGYQFTSTKKLPLAVVPEEQTAPILVFNPNEGEHNQVYVACPPNQRVILETSADLKNWTSVYTNSLAGESFWYNYPNSADKTRFFRTKKME